MSAGELSIDDRILLTRTYKGWGSWVRIALEECDLIGAVSTSTKDVELILDAVEYESDK
jgi:hypothetical protein